MKKVLIFCMMFYLPFTYGQNKIEQEQSYAELFGLKPDVLIEKQFIEIGNVDEIELRAMLQKNLITGETSNAIRFEYQFNNEIMSQTKVAFIDYDEVEALVKALQVMVNEVFNTKKTSTTEVTFRSRSGFIVGGNYSVDKDKWAIFIQLNKNDSRSTVVVDTDELVYFIKLLKQVK